MELYFKIDKGLKPDIFDRLFGMHELKEQVNTVSLCLREASWRKEPPLEVPARFFWNIIRKLAGGRAIRLLFPYDIGIVKKKFSAIGVTAIKEGRWLHLDTSLLQPSEIAQVLQTASFAHFFAQVEGQQKLPKKPAELFNNLNQHYFLAVFSLYDDAMEILSTVLSTDSIINVVHEIGREEKIQVVGESEKLDDPA